MNATIKHKDKSGHCWRTNTKCRRSFDFISSIEEFRSSFTINPFSKFIDLAEVVRWDIIFKEAHIALGFTSFSQPRESGVDVGFATLAPEWTLFSKVNLGHFASTFSVVLGRWLR